MLTLVPAHWRPFLKSIAPAVVGLIAALISLIADGGSPTTVSIALTTLAAATLAYVQRNGPVGLRRFAKAIAPALMAVISSLVTFAITGHWDDEEWTIAITGLSAATITYFVPNATGIAAGRGSASMAGAPAQESTVVDMPHDAA